MRMLRCSFGLRSATHRVSPIVRKRLSGRPASTVADADAAQPSEGEAEECFAALKAWICQGDVCGDRGALALA